MRYQHSGQVCSGDFLQENDSTDGYLIEQGNLISVIWYIFVTFCWLIVASGCYCVYLCNKAPDFYPDQVNEVQVDEVQNDEK